MKTMTWEECDKLLDGLKKRHRMETAETIAKVCVGHKIKEVAERYGYSHQWVTNQLDYAGVGAALGSNKVEPLAGQTDNVAKELPRLVQEFAPDATVRLTGKGGDKAIALDDDGYAIIEGDDAEKFRPYLEHYDKEGHEPAAAIRLAKAEWAGEAAVEKGVIKEGTNKQNKRVNQILFPADSKDTFELDLKMHMARVESAAAFLDKAKVRSLRLRSTCERVAKADAKWKAQAELVLQHYEPSVET